MEEQQNKSSRSFDAWKMSLIKIIASKHGKPIDQVKIDDDRVKPFYDQALMPSVCFNELFNK